MLGEHNRRKKSGLRSYCGKECNRLFRLVPPLKKLCEWCKNEYETRDPDRRFCTRSCSNRRPSTEEANRKTSETLKQKHIDDPEFHARTVAQRLKNNNRFSSKAERALAELLRPLGYHRHGVIRARDLTFDVDIVRDDGRVWVESDGEWHFRQVHEGHDFARTQLRDGIEEEEAVARGVLLVRVNNQLYTASEQVSLVERAVAAWDGTAGTVMKHWE